MMEAWSSDKMFGPLSFEESKCKQLVYTAETKCILCEECFNLNSGLSEFLKHIFEVHYLVIEDVQNIDNLHEYVAYWRSNFKKTSIEQIIPSVAIDSTDKRYFLLSSLLSEDKELRHKLKLEHALKVQEFERTDRNYMKTCLFCRFNFEGARPEFLIHLSTQHNLQLGNPQNLVFIEELIEKIDEKLHEFKCIYCEKTFPDRNTVKEHMRKKLHKRINPNNTEYDKYYIVNYLEPDKTWQMIQKENDKYAQPPGDVNTDEEYSDWQEQQDQITCLFCERKESDINLMCLHLEADHDFDFVKLAQDLDFYQKVKLINYIRKQIHDKKCIFCDMFCENAQSLEDHMVEEKHYKIPEIKVFNQPEFYFPTYENDAFLYLIDDVED